MADAFFVTVRGKPSDDEDADVPGTYMLTLPEDYPPERRASAVLDTFHCKVGISVLEDFSFAVTDSEGKEIAEPHGAAPYQFKDEADFCGKVDPAEEARPAGGL